MPLPDERPRQSVANLIGRFEGQTKRQPSSVSFSPRSSSVVSHTTGDSAKEEVKERREWPPKSVTEAANPPSGLPLSSVLPPSSFRFKSPQTQATSLPTGPEPPASLAEPATNGTSGIKPEAIETPPVPVSSQPETQGTVPEQPNLPPPKTRPPVTPSTPPKATTTRSAPSAKTVTKSINTPKTPAKVTSSPAQPLKAQHTGQSTTSTTGRKPITKTTPSTPARPKTPARTSVTPARPPSSGLYAPTASSLARSRNAPPPAPTPIKKASLSSGAGDRLSKPTAASLSRARSPVTTPSKKVAATATKPATRGGAVSRGTPARGGKTPATPSRVKKSEDAPAVEPTIDPVVTQGTAVAATAVVPDVEPAAEGSQPMGEIPSSPEPEVEVAIEEHATSPSPKSETQVQVSEQEDAELPEHQAFNESPQPELEPEHEPELEPEHEPELEPEHEPELEPEHEPEHEEGYTGPSPPPEEPAHVTVEDDIRDPITDKLSALASNHDGTDIEQIVNFLETVSATETNLESADTLLEIQEIPDEDH